MSNQVVNFTSGADFRATLDGHFIVKLETRETSFTAWRETSPILAEDELDELNLEISRLNNGLTEAAAQGTLRMSAEIQYSRELERSLRAGNSPENAEKHAKTEPERRVRMGFCQCGSEFYTADPQVITCGVCTMKNDRAS